MREEVAATAADAAARSASSTGYSRLTGSRPTGWVGRGSSGLRRVQGRTTGSSTDRCTGSPATGRSIAASRAVAQAQAHLRAGDLDQQAHAAPAQAERQPA